MSLPVRVSLHFTYILETYVWKVHVKLCSDAVEATGMEFQPFTLPEGRSSVIPLPPLPHSRIDNCRLNVN